MGALEDAIAAGDVEKQRELSSLFSGGNSLSSSDFVRSPGGGFGIPDPAKRAAYAKLQGQVEVDESSKRKTLADLVALANATRGLDPEGQAAIYKRFGIDYQPQNKNLEILQRQVVLQAMRNQGRARGGALPADLIGAIGTKDFRQRLQDAAGTLDRQSLDSLWDLDRKEREFQAKGIAKPGKLSPFAQRLREMEALGLPIDENTIRDVYSPTAPGTMTGREDPRRKRPISLSALAGLTGGGEQDEPVAENPLVSEIDDRRSRLRSTLFGDTGGY